MNNVKRLEYLGNKFKLYCNRYHATINTGLSHRFMKWIDEYHNIKENDRDAWNEY